MREKERSICLCVCVFSYTHTLCYIRGTDWNKGDEKNVGINPKKCCWLFHCKFFFFAHFLNGLEGISILPSAAIKLRFLAHHRSLSHIIVKLDADNAHKLLCKPSICGSIFKVVLIIPHSGHDAFCFLRFQYFLMHKTERIMQ